MKKLFLIFCVLFPLTAAAHPGHKHDPNEAYARADIVSYKDGLIRLRIAESLSGKAIKPEDLFVVHTKNIHLLVIDPSLTDYHHLHPTPSKTPGVYEVPFTGKYEFYRGWADITPKSTGKQIYVPFEIGKAPDNLPPVNKTLSNEANIDGLNFKLELDDKMGVVKISKNGQPFKELETVMGTFGHIVGFPEDGKSVMHVHPLASDSDPELGLGGPELKFHLGTDYKGFVKIFVQVKVGGKDIYAPFGVELK